MGYLREAARHPARIRSMFRRRGHERPVAGAVLRTATLPNATVEIVDGASHCLHLEDLQGTAESIRALA